MTTSNTTQKEEQKTPPDKCGQRLYFDACYWDSTLQNDNQNRPNQQYSLPAKAKMNKTNNSTQQAHPEYQGKATICRTIQNSESMALRYFCLFIFHDHTSLHKGRNK